MIDPALLFGLSLLGAGLLFTANVIPIELCALAVVCVLLFAGIVPVQEGFSTFGNESVVLIGSLFVLIEGLKRTGLLIRGQDLILRFSGSSKTLAFCTLLIAVAALSAFVSNTATLAVAIPLAGTIARSYDETPAAWLLPLAFASVLGGMNTLLGTSTNIIISAMLPEYSLPAFHLFSMTPLTCFVLLPGLIYLICFATRMLRKEADYGSFVELKYDLGSYTTELLIEKGSPLVGKTLSAVPLFQDYDLVLLGVTRKNEPFILPHATVLFEEGDRLLVEGSITSISGNLQDLRLKFLDQRPVFSKKGAKEDPIELHEMLVRNNSILNGKTPKQVLLRNRYQLSLLAVRREEETIRSQLSDVTLRPGDLLLVQCLDRTDNELLEHLGLTPLQKLVHEKVHSDKAPFVLLLLILPIILGSCTSLKLSLCCLAAVVLMGILNVMTVEDMFRAIEWRILVFIGSVLVIGRGMELSGAATFLGDGISHLFMGWPPMVILTCFFFATATLTSLVSNQATAVIMIPLAVQTAHAMGMEPMAMVMTITVACSCCFMSPFEPAFMLVYGPGGYRVVDFIKIGLPLTLLAGLITVFMAPILWPLHG